MVYNFIVPYYMFADLAIDRLLYLGKHFLPCAIHHALDQLLMVGEVL